MNGMDTPMHKLRDDVVNILKKPQTQVDGHSLVVYNDHLQYINKTANKIMGTIKYIMCPYESEINLEFLPLNEIQPDYPI